MSETTTITRAEIMKMAKELGVALSQSSEILDYREAERKMAVDPEACRLTGIFKKAHRALAQKQEDPSNHNETEEELSVQLEKADKTMKTNPLIAEYYRTGSAFNNLIYQINQLLKFYCMEPGEEIQFEKSSGCSNCGGDCSK